MQETTPSPAADDDIDDAWDEYDEDQEEEQAAPDSDRESESMDDFYRDLGEEFGMDPNAPSPIPDAESFAHFVAKETARARADAALPPQPKEAAGVESPRPDPAEMIAEAVRTAAGAKGTRPKKHGRKLNYVCKGYKTNDALANCHDINDKVRATLAIINGLMSDKGFCYSSDEQLAIWMHMSVRGAKNLLNDLARKGFIIHIGFSGSNVKRVVRPDLANNRVRTQSLMDEFTNIN